MNIDLTFQIGNGPGYFQYARVSPGTQSEPVDGHLKQLLTGLINRAKLLDLSVRHMGITIDLHPLQERPVQRLHEDEIPGQPRRKGRGEHKGNGKPVGPHEGPSILPGAA